MLRPGVDNLAIPNRFESLLASPYLKFEPLIIEVGDDTRALLRVRDKAGIQQGGILVFLLGETGIGKTTAVYSLSVHVAPEFNPVVAVPPQVDVRDVAAWLETNLPSSNDKALLVLFDGREVTDDEAGLRQFLTSLNQLLRRRRDVLFVWPTTDPDWHGNLRALAARIGGGGLVPKEGDVEIAGPARDDWRRVLDRMLIQYDVTLQDIALEADYVEELASSAGTIGAFLECVGGVIAGRTSKVRDVQALPSLVFVVSSGAEVVGEANRLRRARTHIVKAEELLAYSPRSEAGKWWRARLGNPQHHLAYIISLFDARLTTLTPSAMAYACLHQGPQELRRLVAESGLKANSGNAATTLRATDLYRFLAGGETAELTSSRKGKTKDPSLNAYRRIQGRSASLHRAITETICRHLGDQLPGFRLRDTRYEVDAGEQNLYTDCIAAVGEDHYHLEFHHLSPSQCKASRMASYIMDKLRSYALHYNLVPR